MLQSDVVVDRRSVGIWWYPRFALAGGVVGCSVYEVLAGGWQLWVAVWAIRLLCWVGVVGSPVVGSVVSGWVLLVVVGVSGICIVGLVSGLLVGGWLEVVVVWCAGGVGRLRCRFRIWCVMVVVG